MYYAQVKNDSATELENALYEWDAFNYCTPESLVKDGKGGQFGVVPLVFVSAPSIDPLAQSVSRDGCEFVDDAWRYKWKVNQLSREQISANLAEQVAGFLKRIDADVDQIYATALGNRTPEYQKAEEQAQKYRAEGYAGDVPKAVAAWANATGKSAQWAADDIIATADAWHAAEDAIREQRLMCKQLARNAPADDALSLVRIQWSDFVTQIRTQLSD